MLSDSNYLRSLHSALIKDPSQIKYFIKDIPYLYSDNTNEKHLIFSRLESLEDEEMFCVVIQNLLKRVSISVKRSKQAFTSMWDGIRRALQCILDDSLALKNRSNQLNRVLRQILHLNISPKIERIECNCEWLAMDLDIQSKKLTHSKSEELPKITCELDQKTLFMYCDQFFTAHFIDYFHKIEFPSDDLIKLFFKDCYFHPNDVVKLIKKQDGLVSSKFIDCLINLEICKWKNFNEASMMAILLFISQWKNYSQIFCVLATIADSLDFRSTQFPSTNNTIIDFMKYPVEGLSDAALCKYWGFVFSALSSESLSFENKNHFKSRIMLTLMNSNTFQKSKCAVCRVISILWGALEDSYEIFDLLLNILADRINSSKLKWNIAIALINFDSNYEQFKAVQRIWIFEMGKVSNFKLMNMLTNLILRWGIQHQELDNLRKGYEDVLWEALGKVKTFIVNNEGSLECCEDDAGGGEEKIIENAVKFEQQLKSILIDQDNKFS